MNAETSHLGCNQITCWGAVAAVLLISSFATITPANADKVAVSDELELTGPPGGGVLSQVLRAFEGDEGEIFAFDDSVPVDPDYLGYFIGLYEPDGSISDIVGLFDPDGDGTHQLGFISDPGNLVGYIIAESFTEVPGLIVDVTKFLSPQYKADGYTATFWSDVEAVPLPPALPLFAGGLGLMGWMARRKRKQAAHA